MKLVIVSYGHPIYKSLLVACEKNSLDALDKADKYMKEECGHDLNGVQITCFGVYNDIKIL